MSHRRGRTAAFDGFIVFATRGRGSFSEQVWGSSTLSGHFQHEVRIVRKRDGFIKGSAAKLCRKRDGSGPKGGHASLLRGHFYCRSNHFF